MKTYNPHFLLFLVLGDPGEIFWKTSKKLQNFHEDHQNKNSEFLDLKIKFLSCMTAPKEYIFGLFRSWRVSITVTSIQAR